MQFQKVISRSLLFPNLLFRLGGCFNARTIEGRSCGEEARAEDFTFIDHFAQLKVFRMSQHPANRGGEAWDAGSPRSQKPVGLQGSTPPCRARTLVVASFGIKTRQLVYATPVDEEHIELRIGASVQKLPDEGATAALRARLREPAR